MKRLPDGSVDCIIDDLPYNLTVLFAGGKFTHKLIASNFDRYKYKWIFEEILIFTSGRARRRRLFNVNSRFLNWRDSTRVPADMSYRDRKAIYINKSKTFETWQANSRVNAKPTNSRH